MMLLARAFLFFFVLVCAQILIVPEACARAVHGEVPKKEKAGRAHELGRSQPSKDASHEPPYLNHLLKIRDGWIWDASGSEIVWKVLMEQADVAAKEKDYKKELELIEGALEQSRCFANHDPRRAETIARLKECAEKQGHHIDQKEIADVILPPAYLEERFKSKVLNERKPISLQPLSPIISEADLWMFEGKTDAATKTYEKALRILNARPVHDDHLIVKTIDRLSRIYYKENRFNDIEVMARKEIKRHDSMFERMDDTDLEKLHLAFLLADLGLAYIGDERLVEAEALYLRALKIMRRQLGENHVDYIVTLSELARVHKHMGNLSQSEKEYREAISLFKKNEVLGRMARGVIMGNYAKLLRRMGKDKAADSIEAQSVQKLQKQTECDEDIEHQSLLPRHDQSKRIRCRRLQLRDPNYPTYASTRPGIAGNQEQTRSSEPLCF